MNLNPTSSERMKVVRGIILWTFATIVCIAWISHISSLILNTEVERKEVIDLYSPSLLRLSSYDQNADMHLHWAAQFFIPYKQSLNRNTVVWILSTSLRIKICADWPRRSCSPACTVCITYFSFICWKAPNAFNTTCSAFWSVDNFPLIGSLLLLQCGPWFLQLLPSCSCFSCIQSVRHTLAAMYNICVIQFKFRISRTIAGAAWEFSKKSSPIS